MSLQETPSRAGKRAIKFSPANIEKIKSFVAQGVNRNKIAERLGVTVGSLQVTCSRLGISLRKPNGYSYGRRPVAAGSSTYARHIGMVSATPPKFEIVLHRRGTTQSTVLPLTDSHIARLGLEAWVQDFKYRPADDRSCGWSNQEGHDLGNTSEGYFRLGCLMPPTASLPSSPTPSRRPAFPKLRFGFLQGRHPPRASNRSVDGHRPEPIQIVGTAAILVDPTDTPLAGKDGVVRPALVDPGAEAGRASLRARLSLRPRRPRRHALQAQGRGQRVAIAASRTPPASTARRCSHATKLSAANMPEPTVLRRGGSMRTSASACGSSPQSSTALLRIRWSKP